MSEIEKDMMPEIRKAARENGKFRVTEDGDVTIKDGVEHATLVVEHD